MNLLSVAQVTPNRNGQHDHKNTNGNGDAIGLGVGEFGGDFGRKGGESGASHERDSEDNTSDFLQLSDEEAMLVEIKLSLINAVRQSREKHGLSQIDLAQKMGSSQSRVAKIEAGDPSVTLDLIVRALISTGASRRDVQRALVAKDLATA